MGWDRLGKWISATIVASLTWTAALGAIEPARAAPASGSVRGETPGWAQADDQPPIEQVGEETAGDPEPLDESAPPAQTTSDPEPLDSAVVDEPGDVEDIETLDQGSPPTTGVATTPVPATTATTAPTAAAPVQHEPTGPVLPPGFGSGRVHVSAGRGAFPVGLDECHVGVVTGRAYVGIDCDEMDDVVGHARSFDDFPFIPEVDFPFEGDEPFFVNRDFPFDSDDEPASDSGFFDGGFFASGDSDRDDDTRLVVSAGDGANGATADEIAERGVAVSGDGSIEVAQRTRDRSRDPIERLRDRGRNRDSRRRNNDSANSNSANNGNNNNNSNRNRGSNNNVSSASNDNNSRSKSKSKKSRKRNKNRKKNKSNKNDRNRASVERKQTARDGKKRDKRDKKRNKKKRDKKREKREKREKKRARREKKRAEAKKQAQQEQVESQNANEGDE